LLLLKGKLHILSLYFKVLGSVFGLGEGLYIDHIIWCLFKIVTRRRKGVDNHTIEINTMDFQNMQLHVGELRELPETELTRVRTFTSVT